MRTLWLSVLCMAATAVWGMDFYVAPQGKDSNPGTKDKPFATLEAARDTLRELKKNGQLKVGATLWLRGGVYERSQTFELNEQDSGTKEHPIIYRALEGEEVRIVGGREVPAAAATPITDVAVKKRIISDDAKDKVLQIDLKKLGITDYGRLKSRGFSRPVVSSPMELFVNDEAQRLSRWPNTGWLTINTLIDAGAVPRQGDYSKRGGTIAYDDNRPALWQDSDNIWMAGCFKFRWADDMIRVKTHDRNTRRMTLDGPHLYGLKNGGVYAFVNVLEEIDLPGEYYVDTTNGTLYFYPPAGVDMAKARIAVSLLEGPLVAMEGVSHVVIRDVILEASRGMGVYIEEGTGNLIAGCTLRNLGTVAVSMGMGIEPFAELRHAGSGKPASRIIGSLDTHRYDNTAFNRKAGTNHGVVGCDIYATGTGGVNLGGGDRKTLTPGGNYVENCDIHHFNRLDKTNKPGVYLDGVGNRVRHCEIHHSPHWLISLEGNDHLIEYNDIHHGVMEADDAGAFCYDRDPGEQGNVLRYNAWHHNGSPDKLGGHGTWNLHLDNTTCGLEVVGNVFYANQSPAEYMAFTAGFDHKVSNNIFIANGREKAMLVFWDNGYDYGGSGALYTTRLKVVNYTEPPYATRYPQLLKTAAQKPASPAGNEIVNNVVIGCKDLVLGRGKRREFQAMDVTHNVVKDNLVLDTDPGFVNMAKDDYRLKPDSIIYKKLPGFRPIPFEKIGLQKDEYRN